MTRKDHLVQLVAGLISDPNRSDSVAGHVSEAVLFLAEIEKVCPDATLIAASVGAEVYTQDAVDALVAKTRADEREQCAKIAEQTHGYPASPGMMAKRIAVAIRRGGA